MIFNKVGKGVKILSFVTAAMIFDSYVESGKSDAEAALLTAKDLSPVGDCETIAEGLAESKETFNALNRAIKGYLGANYEASKYAIPTIADPKSKLSDTTPTRAGDIRVVK